MAFELLSEAEIASWLRPSETLEMLPADWDVSLKRRLILRRLADGAIKAYAATAKYWEGNHVKRERLVRIGQHLFARPWNTYDHDFWTAGDISFDDEKPLKLVYVFPEDFDDDPGPTKGASFTGVRLDPASFQQAFDLPPASMEPDQQGDGPPIAAAEMERFARLYLDTWGERATEMKALAAIRATYPDNRIGRDAFLTKFRELRGPGKVGKPSKDSR